MEWKYTNLTFRFPDIQFFLSFRCSRSLHSFSIIGELFHEIIRPACFFWQFLFSWKGSRNSMRNQKSLEFHSDNFMVCYEWTKKIHEWNIGDFVEFSLYIDDIWASQVKSGPGTCSRSIRWGWMKLRKIELSWNKK